MTSTAQTIKFNVGGTHYEVSKSLLDNFEGSMLERSASKVWNEGGDEVFIEGNGHRFQYVLDFMRHGKVTLPSSETIDAFFTEMKYYGMNCNLENVLKCGDDSIPNLFSKLTEAIDLLEVDKFVTLIAHNILKKYCDVNISSGKKPLVVTYQKSSICKNSSSLSDVNIDDYQVYTYLEKLNCPMYGEGYENITAKVNAMLMSIGLKVEFSENPHGYDGTQVKVSRI